MNPGTQSELLVLVSRVRDEAVALLEGLYECYPELRPASYDAAKAWDESKHPRGQPENAGQFAESAAFRRAKEETIRALRPYTVPGSDEACVCLLKEDGSVFDSKVGEPSMVKANVPVEKHCAIFHTHDTRYPHGEGDFIALLSTKSVRESYVVCSDQVYKLHKPKAFQHKEWHESEIIDSYDEISKQVAIEMWNAGERFQFEEATISLTVETAQRLAARLGLKFDVENT